MLSLSSLDWCSNQNMLSLSSLDWCSNQNNCHLKVDGFEGRWRRFLRRLLKGSVQYYLKGSIEKTVLLWILSGGLQLFIECKLDYFCVLSLTFDRKCNIIGAVRISETFAFQMYDTRVTWLASYFTTIKTSNDLSDSWFCNLVFCMVFIKIRF